VVDRSQESGAQQLLWVVPVFHEGDQTYFAEEVARVAAIVEYLTQGGCGWINRLGGRRPLTSDDILIVTPYDDQVTRLKQRLPGARVGTVDKFQGQEAAVVIYSMTTSAPEDAPRGIEFLYKLNRFNVATSRARCACIVVARGFCRRNAAHPGKRSLQTPCVAMPN